MPLALGPLLKFRDHKMTSILPAGLLVSGEFAEANSYLLDERIPENKIPEMRQTQMLRGIKDEAQVFHYWLFT